MACIDRAWRSRVLCGLASVGLVASLHAVAKGPDARARAIYFAVLSLGYGHFLGSLFFSRSRLAARAPGNGPRLLGWAFAGLGIATLFSIYTWMIHVVPAGVYPLLTLAVWHTLENDLALARAYRGPLRLGPIRWGAHAQGRAVGWAVVIGLLAAAADPTLRLPGPLPAWITVADIFGVSSLYHLFAWLIFFFERMRAARRQGQIEAARRTRRRLLLTHVPMGALCIGLTCIDLDSLEVVRVLLLSPATYLFWSTLHVCQTARARFVTETPRFAALRANGWRGG